MQKTKRLKIIKDYLLEHKDVQIHEFNDLIDVSESTIRRDIKSLASEGFLKEEYGSVVLLEHNDFDTVLSKRTLKNIEEKRIAARKAALKIEDHSLIYIDAGSTTLHMPEYIIAKNCTFVTNGMHIATELVQYGHTDVHVIGGRIKKITMAIIGEEAIANLQHYYFDACFIGANGVCDKGYSTPDLREGIVKNTVITRTKKSYVVADYSKIGKTSSYVFATKDQCKLISNK